MAYQSTIVMLSSEAMHSKQWNWKTCRWLQARTAWVRWMLRVEGGRRRTLRWKGGVRNFPQGPRTDWALEPKSPLRDQQLVQQWN